MNMMPAPNDPTLVDALHHASIRCGAGAKDRLVQLGKSLRAYDCTPTEFYCKDCHQRWLLSEMSGAGDVDTIACSNCYSENVLIVQVKVTFVRFPKK